MRRRQRGFGVGEQFLEQFLAGAQAGELDLDVLVRKAGKADHVARQVGDAYRVAHVEDENLAALAHQPGLQHQLRRLGDGHEIPHDVPVGYRDRATGRDLLLELRDHAAGRAQHIAESHDHKARGAGGCAFRVEALAYQFRHAFRGAHHIGRVDGLVGGHQHEFLHAGGAACRAQGGGAQHVVGQRLAGVFAFHHRHMLVGGGMEHHRRLVVREHPAHARAIAHVADHAGKRLVGRHPHQFLLDAVERKLAVFDQHQPGRCEAHDLTHQFRADRTAGARDHHRAIRQQGLEAIVVQHHLLAPQQVVELDLADRRHLHLAADHVVERGDGQRLQICQAAGLDDAAPFARGGFGPGDDGMGGGQVRRILGQAVKPADHRGVLQGAPGEARVVVDQANHAPVGRSRECPGQPDGRIPGPDHQHRGALDPGDAEQAMLLP